MILSIKRDTKDHRREVQKVWRARTGESKCLHSSHLARPVWPVFSSSLFATESESFDFELLHTRSLGLSRNLPRRFHDNPIERLRWRLTYPANEKKRLIKLWKSSLNIAPFGVSEISTLFHVFFLGKLCRDCLVCWRPSYIATSTLLIGLITCKCIWFTDN